MPTPKDLKGIFFCLDCESVALSESSKRGHFLVTIFLLLCGILPGVLYMIYRSHTAGKKCEHCGSKNLIPMSSARVKTRLGDNYATVLDDGIEYAKPSQKATQRQTYLIAGLVFVFVLMPLLRIPFMDRTPPPPPPVKATPEVAKAPEKIKSSEPRSNKLDIKPARDGDASEVASFVISGSDQKCDVVLKAERLDDGSIAAICHNGNDYVRYRVFKFLNAGETHEIALNCNSAKIQGIVTNC